MELVFEVVKLPDPVVIAFGIAAGIFTHARGRRFGPGAARRWVFMQIMDLARRARQASYALAVLPVEQRNAALKGIKKALESQKAEIYLQNLNIL